MIRLAAVQIAKRKGKPFQLLPVSSMIAWMTFGPIIEDARFERPNRPKNCASRNQRPGECDGGGARTMLSKPGGVSSAIIVCEKA